MRYRNYLITYQPPPIPARNFDYQFCHEDYDGPGDDRCGTAASEVAAKQAIDEIEGPVSDVVEKVRSPKIDRAEELAAIAHHGQWRKYGGDPYLVHPVEVHLRVAEFLASLGYEFPNDETEKQRITMECAAYLHDVLEDCPQISEQEIVDATDEDVLKLVKELTNPSKGSTASRAVRKQMDRDHLEHVSWEAKIIKLVDRICNLRDIQACPDKGFIQLYASESKLLLESLKGTHPALEGQLGEAIRCAFLSVPGEGIVMRKSNGQ